MVKKELNSPKLLDDAGIATKSPKIPPEKNDPAKFLAEGWVASKHAKEDIEVNIHLMKGEMEKRLAPYVDALRAAEQEEAVARESLLSVMRQEDIPAIYGDGYAVNRRRLTSYVLKDPYAVIQSLKREEMTKLAAQLLGIAKVEVVDQIAPRQISKSILNELNKRYDKFTGNTIEGTERVDGWTLALSREGEHHKEDNG